MHTVKLQQCLLKLLLLDCAETRASGVLGPQSCAKEQCLDPAPHLTNRHAPYSQKCNATCCMFPPTDEKILHTKRRLTIRS